MLTWSTQTLLTDVQTTRTLYAPNRLRPRGALEFALSHRFQSTAYGMYAGNVRKFLTKFVVTCSSVRHVCLLACEVRHKNIMAHEKLHPLQLFHSRGFSSLVGHVQIGLLA